MRRGTTMANDYINIPTIELDDLPAKAAAAAADLLLLGSGGTGYKLTAEALAEYVLAGYAPAVAGREQDIISAVNQVYAALGQTSMLSNFHVDKEILESGYWAYSTKASSSKRLRNKVLFRVRNGMVVRYTNPAHKLYFGVLATPTSGSYLQVSGWINAGAVNAEYQILNDGYMVFQVDSSTDITVDDFNDAVDILADSYRNLTVVNQSYYSPENTGWINYTAEWISGGMYDATGIVYSTSARSITNFIPVVPGETFKIMSDFTDLTATDIKIVEFAENTITTSTNNVRLRNTSISNGNGTFTVGSTTNYIRMQVNDPAASVAMKVIFSRNAPLPCRGVIYRVFTTLAEALLCTQLSPGQVIAANGFNSPNDFGGGYYIVSIAGVTNNSSVFQISDNLYLHRLFVNDFLYLESLNIGNISYGTINDIIEESKITDIRCNAIKISESIAIKNYNLNFGEIYYSGTGYAVTLDGVVGKNIIGNKINAPNGSGLALTTTLRDAVRNKIFINEIFAKHTGVSVRPINSHGVMHNNYQINYMECGQYGFSTYIPASTGGYSWQGEESLSLCQIKATNENENGVGVSFRIEPDPSTGQCIDGTITGVTFWNLAFEDSDIGVEMICGTMYPNDTFRCIKSIYANSVRVRESANTKIFFRVSGFVRDVYLKPTSPIRLNTTDIDTTVGSDPLIIDCPLFYYYDQLTPIAFGLIAKRHKVYVKDRLSSSLTVSNDVDFSVFDNPESSIPEGHTRIGFVERFNISDSLRGQSVNINLKHYGDDSADGLLFYLPGKTLNEGAVTVNVKYYIPEKTITLTNNDTEPHLYKIIVTNGLSWSDDINFSVIDLGTPILDENVPHDYSQPT